MRITNDFLHSLMLKFISKTFLRKRETVKGSWNYEKTVTISFDCDYAQDMITCAKIMKTLNLYDIKASFALTGKLVKEFPAVVESIIANEHEIINHTYNHYPEFRSLSSDKKLQEISSFQNLIKDNFGSKIMGFRAPHLRQGKQKDLFEILKKLCLFDSSLIGYGVQKLDDVLEIPLTAFPEFKNLPFCTYHHFRMPLLSASQNSFMNRWKRLLTQQDFINVYLDPIDFASSNRLLTDLIKVALAYDFTFCKLKDISRRLNS